MSPARQTRIRRWEKLGLMFAPSGGPAWMSSHAAVPFARHLDGSAYEVFFSSRDASGRSHVGRVVVDIERPGRVLELDSQPLLAPGGLGEFDDSGAMLSWIVPGNDVNYWYYIGWNLGRTVPFRNSVGLALESAGGVDRAFQGPVLDRTRFEPHFVASCCVIREDALWRIYYLSCVGWVRSAAGTPVHRYHIKYAESGDGIDWHREGKVAIDFQGPSEYAISRPSVMRDPGGYRMWYSCRGDSYRIGYAQSRDGIGWQRRDEEAGIDVSASGWDSDMVCYPHVVGHGDHDLMFYNGNGYGFSGFGLAIRPKCDITPGDDLRE